MEIIVTSDSTALTAISSDARTGNPTRTKLFTPKDWGVRPRPTVRPITKKITTGTRIVPIAPRGSRMKILISIHVNFHSPCSIIFAPTLESPTLEWNDQSVLETHPQGSEEWCGNL